MQKNIIDKNLVLKLKKQNVKIIARYKSLKKSYHFHCSIATL